jgi:hypothetical protein
MQQCCMTYITTKMTCFNANTIINRVWFSRLKFEAFFSEKCQENPYFRPEILNSTTNSDWNYHKRQSFRYIIYKMRIFHASDASSLDFLVYSDCTLHRSSTVAHNRRFFRARLFDLKKTINQKLKSSKS